MIRLHLGAAVGVYSQTGVRPGAGIASNAESAEAALIAHPIAVRVDRSRAIAGVAGITVSVEVAVRLIGIENGWTVVTGITDSITISIFLTGIGSRTAVVARIAYSIMVRILLAGISGGATVIADVPNSVTI